MIIIRNTCTVHVHMHVHINFVNTLNSQIKLIDVTRKKYLFNTSHCISGDLFTCSVQYSKAENGPIGMKLCP